MVVVVDVETRKWVNKDEEKLHLLGKEVVLLHQCDQIVRFIGLWATF